MITAEQARQNAEYHRKSIEESRAKLAAEFVEKNVEPAIIEASTHGKSEVTVNISNCLEALSKIAGIITGAGFTVKRGRNDALIIITW